MHLFRKILQYFTISTDKERSERASSAAGEGYQMERRNSATSLAPSESSRSDLATRHSRHPELSVAKNYFKQVSDNKEVSKLVSILATAINSTKKVSYLSTDTVPNLGQIEINQVLY